MEQLPPSAGRPTRRGHENEQKKVSFKAMYTNIDGITNKTSELGEWALEENPDIIALTETKLTKTITNAVFPQDYNVVRKEREGRGGGGVALLIRKGWSFEEMVIQGCEDFSDYITGTIAIGGQKIIVVVIYNPPPNDRRPRQEYDRNNMATISIIERAASVASRNGSRLLIMGDFNHGKIDWENGDPHGGPDTWRAKLLDVATRNFLSQHIKGPTRMRGEDEPAMLDLIFTLNESDIREVKLEAPLGMSDHSVVIFEYLVELGFISPKKELGNKRLAYRKGKYEEMRKFLRDIPWDTELRTKSVQDMMDYVTQKCQEAVNRFIPAQKEKTERQKKNPWFNRACMEARELNKRAWRNFRNNRTPESRERYQRTRNEYVSVRREAEKKYENDIASKAKTEPKLLHSHIRRKTTVKEQVMKLRMGEDRYTENDKEVCEELNKRFQEVFTIERGEVTALGEVAVNQAALEGFEITRDEVKRHLLDLDVRKAVGPDGISPWVLKECAEALSLPLSIVYGRSLETGDLPEIWKTANVVPIYKKGDRQEALNYRPVSLTCIPCKVMEKIVRKNLVTHLERRDFVTTHQHGFREGKSCLTGLIEFYDQVTKIKQEREGWADCIFLDCRKAFDTVPHKRLVHKLEKQAGVTGRVLQWIREYLSNRKQRVTVRGETSDWREVTSGVPQGSVLGPILFLIYVNDLPEGIDSFLSMFADDAKIMRRIKTEEDSLRLQEDLDKLKEWSNKWLLEFNPSKCNVMKIGAGSRRPDTRYHLGDEILKESEREKDLGVDITPDLSPEAHIKRITSAAYARLANIRTAFRNLCKESFRTLYTTYVRPILEYAAPAWSPYLVKHKTKLEKVQRFATRLVPELRGMSYEERLRELNLTSLGDRRVRGDMITTYKILRGIDRVDKDRLFNTRDARTRGHRWKLSAQMSHRDGRKNFFSVRVVDKWNALGNVVVEADSIHSFKSRYDRAQ